jgi:hypothetical protein
MPPVVGYDCTTALITVGTERKLSAVCLKTRAVASHAGGKYPYLIAKMKDASSEVTPSARPIPTSFQSVCFVWFPMLEAKELNQTHHSSAANSVSENSIQESPAMSAGTETVMAVMVGADGVNAAGASSAGS